ncbi:MAG: hypothetical protein VX498_08140 [Myxococcota bacterium]|nr:hypothetical protein [Myxococcota bacterium]
MRAYKPKLPRFPSEALRICMYDPAMLSSSSKALPIRRLIPAVGVALSLAVTPSMAMACSLCADAASRVTMPGVLDAGRVLLLFFVASAALMLFGRISGAEWRLGSKLYWLVGAAAVLGGFVAATTGLTLAAGPLLILASLVRIYRAAKLPSLSTRELLAALLAGLFVLAGPTALLIGNQRADSLDHLFAALASGHPVTADEALRALQTRDEAAARACDRLGEITTRKADSQEARPMEWFGLMRIAQSRGSCPDAVLALQTLCDFPEEAELGSSLSCAGQAKDTVP